MCIAVAQLYRNWPCMETLYKQDWPYELGRLSHRIGQRLGVGLAIYGQGFRLGQGFWPYNDWGPKTIWGFWSRWIKSAQTLLPRIILQWVFMWFCLFGCSTASCTHTCRDICNLFATPFNELVSVSLSTTVLPTVLQLQQYPGHQRCP